MTFPTSPPRVLMVSTSYPANLFDWRGLFIRHMVDALARRNDLSLALWAPPGDIPANVESVCNPTERAWLDGLMRAGGIAHLYRAGGVRAILSPIRIFWMLRSAYRRCSAAIYHVNWMQNALALPDNGRPLVVSVLGTDLQFLKLPFMRAWLRRVFKRRSTIVCPNAEWMVGVLQEAFGSVAEVRFVPFGIDPSWFDVRRLPLGASPRIWLCITRITRGKLGKLAEWGASSFGDGSRELHLFGPMQEDIELPSWVHYHGAVGPEVLCRDWFPRAQGLITLSQHAEGRPQVILEAMAAGLPIVASSLPAHVDMIEDGRWGTLCASASDVERAVTQLDEPGKNHTMGMAGRSEVTDRVGTWDDCAARFAAIYRELLDPGA